MDTRNAPRRALLPLTLVTLTLGLACDHERPAAPARMASAELDEAREDARDEFIVLAAEVAPTAETPADFATYVCEQSETPELVDACALREDTPTATIDDLRASSPSAADPWSCIENNACGGQTEYCFCDWACIFFGDCCYDYGYCP